jgi:hypothetical protein
MDSTTQARENQQLTPLISTLLQYVKSARIL